MDRERDFERFFKQNYSRYYYFALQLIGNGEVCRDIVSDSFEQAWLALKRDGALSISSFVYSLVRNKCIDYVRHEMSKARYADFYTAMYSEVYEEFNDDHERHVQIMLEAMESLTPRTREVLELCYFKRKTHSEAAAELGISVSAVKKHIAGALKSFRIEIAKKLKQEVYKNKNITI